MTERIPWFREQLRSGADVIAWAVSQIDPSLHHVQPPPELADYMGAWPPARHVWHLALYERCIALPSMRQFIGGPPLSDDPCPGWDDWSGASGRPIDSYVTELRAIRAEQIAFLDETVEADWTTPRATVWGQQSLAMIATKTLQHTLEHGDTLLRMALWWRPE